MNQSLCERSMLNYIKNQPRGNIKKPLNEYMETKSQGRRKKKKL